MIDPLSSKIRVLVATAILAGAGLGTASVLGWTSTSLAGPAFLEQPQVSEEAVQPAVDLSTAFVEISEAVTPGVVRIEVERPGRRTAQGPDFFDFFFGPPGSGNGDRGQQEPQPSLSGGSGFIVSDEGYIVTNDHVVSGADGIQVHLHDGRQYRGEVVGTDPTTDVAVIRIDQGNLPTLSLGSSSETRVGEWVLAVGNPGVGGRALEYTVTSGIVSAIGRPLDLLGPGLLNQEGYEDIANYAIEDFIQTDAVINPGNSGGPLVNVRGQVVGINTAIASRTGYYQGYGFAVPIDLAARIVEDLIEHGEVRRPLLGIAMQEVTNVDAEFYGLPRPHGVVIQNVQEDSPAARAGLRQEDVVVAVNGDVVERPGQLQLLIAQQRPGDEVTVRFYRDGEPREVDVVLGQADLEPSVAEAAPATEPRAEERLGIEVTRLTPEIANELGYDRTEGVVIEQVNPTGPAGRNGLQRGLVIDEINREPVDEVDDVQRILGEIEPGDIVSLRVALPDGTTRVVNIRLPR